jgi:hypothetical protein
MKVGDLLTSKEINEIEPMLIVIGIDKHPGTPDRDRIHLQWMPRNGGMSIRGSFSRLIAEQRYRVL